MMTDLRDRLAELAKRNESLSAQLNDARAVIELNTGQFARSQLTIAELEQQVR